MIPPRPPTTLSRRAWLTGSGLCGLVGLGSLPTRATVAPPHLDNNLHCVDLSDLKRPLPLHATTTQRILHQTEPWEHSAYQNPQWPAGGADSLGYPTVVRNQHGANPDGKYYLYYAHHDPMSGIGCTVAEDVSGPFVKIADLPGSSRTHSRILTVPNYDPNGPNPGDPSHYSSPCVLWNQDEQLWFLYFHYFNHFHSAWTSDPNAAGEGWQMTGLATCPELASHTWTIWKDPQQGNVSVWDIVPVLTTTEEPWMRSASSYHAIQRLPDGRWLAFLRGTPTDNTGPTLGFATSTDGRRWQAFAENPLMARGKPWTRPANEYRPVFVGYLGPDPADQPIYLVAWSEHSHPQVIYSTTTDFKTFTRDPRGYATWGGTDGLVSAWREDSRLYLFAGHALHKMALPVAD